VIYVHVVDSRAFNGRLTVLDEFDFFKCRRRLGLIQDFCTLGLF
jgi:hypothetical protein